jgi:MFS family permease
MQNAVTADRIFTVPFILLCLSSFLFFASFNMMIPELPAFLTGLGGAEYKGLIIALFTITAGISRPFSGKLTDTIGRVPVMAFGSLVCFVCGFLYPLLQTVSAFLLLRLVHGFSTGFKPTGTSAYVADVVPADRRGEAMGWLGLSGTVGMAIAPQIGSAVTAAFSMNFMFYTSSVLALLSIAILLGMPETLPNKVRFRPGLLKISRGDIYEPRVFPAAFVTLLTSFSYGTVLTITPDESDYLGLSNKGLFFTVFTVSSLGTRFLAGKFSDRLGRVPVLKVSSLALGLSMVMTGLAHSPAVFLASAVAYGIAIGTNSPTLSAWTIDLSQEEFRGKAVATMYIFLEIGIGLGAFLSAWLYNNEADRFGWSFVPAAATSFMAFGYLLWYQPAKAGEVSSD